MTRTFLLAFLCVNLLSPARALAQAILIPVDSPPAQTGPIPVQIDVRPDSEQNPVNPSARGVVPVALFGSAQFSVEEVDTSTLVFGPAGAREKHGQTHPADYNEDGFLDLLLHYGIRETGIARGDAQVCLAGEMLDGRHTFQGCDTVSTRPAGAGGPG